MTTERLYRDCPYLARFEADVLAERRLGDRPAVVLSRTAFYPEGGGQPADRGSLGGAAVVDVQEVEGEILHACEGPIPAGRVRGEIDWARRFDHMQQHHGQHLLSAAFEAAVGAETTSFHLGEETCTLDLDRDLSEVAPALRAAEAAANCLVWRDLVVEARELSAAELVGVALRKQPTKGSRIVFVREEGPLPGSVVTAIPCGGTHPRRTGEVGAIAVLGAQRWGHATRVDFACGGRVLRLLRRDQERLAGAAEALRCGPAEVAACAGRLSAESLARRKELDRAAGLLAEKEAERLAAHPPAPGAVIAEIAIAAGEPVAYLRAVAQALSARGRVACLGARADGRALLCFARPRATAGAPDLGKLLREAVGVLGGRGGGAADLAQGGGPSAERLPEALALARARLASPAGR